MKNLVEITRSPNNSKCSHCKEEVRKGEKVYLAVKTGWVCHFACGPAAKSQTKRREAAKAKAQQTHWNRTNARKTAQDIEYHTALKRQRPL